jgi:bifunctional glutamyl/prolyl-tRNA synthetase
MVHGDNKGLVLPPRVANVQIVVVPCGITAKLTDEERADVMKNCQSFVKTLKDADIRCHGDFRDNYSPGWKFNHWELKGVPVRVEIGPRDVQNNQYVAVRRDTGIRIIGKQDEHTNEWLKGLLEDIQTNMFFKFVCLFVFFT